MNNRPPKDKRKFTSDVIENKIEEVKSKVKNKEIAILFENCFPNTLDTTIFYKNENGQDDTYVITGDIPAMWFRDSTAQVFPYLKFVNDDEKLKRMLRGVINRHTKNILIDPYANAFNDGPTGGEWQDDLTDMKPEIHERKWEIDSLCYPIRLVYHYWKITNDTSCFDEKWLKAIRLIIKTFKEQQRKDNDGSYKFLRRTTCQTDTVAGGGWGNPIKPNGLIVSIFRPSDDATIFPFLIPSNFFAVTSLRQLTTILKNINGDDNLINECKALADEVEKAIYDFALFEHKIFGKIIAYEVDGFGNQLFMDDANVPSLLGLKYLDCCTPDDELYRNTRKFVLSEYNPYFFKGKFGEGVGSPHTLKNKIWPLSIIIQAITSHDEAEINKCLNILKNTHAGRYFMHESFDKDNPAEYTRGWFAWANTLFGELIIHLLEEGYPL